jgi:signal transduction histidine kinase/CheY-like chemotaxis protein
MGRDRRRIYLILLAAVLLPLILFGTLQGAFLMRAAQERIEADASLRARTVNASIDGLVRADESALRVLATSQFFASGDLPRARDRVAAVQAARPRWRNVYLIDLDTDRVLWETARVIEAPYRAPQRIRGYGEPFSAFGRAVERATPCACVIVHAQVLQDRRPKYLLSLELDVQDIQDALMANSPPGAISAVVDQSGLFIARTTDIKDRIGTPATRYVRDAIQTREGGFYRGVTYEGLRNHTAFDISDLTGWSTHVAINEELLAGPRRVSLLLTLLAAMTATVLAAALGWFGWRQLEARRQEEVRKAHADKLTAIGELASGVSHDFNNLLTVITTSAEFLKRQDLTDARRLRYVSAISEAATRAAALTGQLLAFARRQPLKSEVFDVSTQVMQASELIRPMLGERIKVDLELCRDHCFARSDPDQLQSALLNLASNARDAMRNGGRLSISVSRAPAIPPTRGQPKREGEFIAIEIVDTGSGIEEKRLDRIFEPFVTSKTIGEGTGLGLSQVLGFAQQSGGDITVESRVGEGSTFRLYLPASPDPPIQAAPTRPSVPSEIARSSVRILVVEDNDAVGQFSTELLHDLGFKTTWVSSAHEALSLIAASPSGFDLVLSDVVMPGMTGLELAKTLRQLHPDIAIILASGYTGVTTVESLEGVDLLAKPYSLAELSAAIERALRGRAGATRRP